MLEWLRKWQKFILKKKIKFCFQICLRNKHIVIFNGLSNLRGFYSEKFPSIAYYYALD